MDVRRHGTASARSWTSPSGSQAYPLRHGGQGRVLPRRKGGWHLITPTGEERKGSLLQMAKGGALQAPEGETAEGVPGWQILRPRHRQRPAASRHRQWSPPQLCPCSLHSAPPVPGLRCCHRHCRAGYLPRSLVGNRYPPPRQPYVRRSVCCCFCAHGASPGRAPKGPGPGLRHPVNGGGMLGRSHAGSHLALGIHRPVGPVDGFWPFQVHLGFARTLTRLLEEHQDGAEFPEPVGEPELKMQIPRYPPVGKPIPVIPFGQGIHVFHKPVDSFFKQLPDFFMASSLL